MILFENILTKLKSRKRKNIKYTKKQYLKNKLKKLNFPGKIKLKTNFKLIKTKNLN